MLSAHSCPLGKLGTRDTGGMSVYLLELARELSKLGHTVDIYTRVHDPRDRLIYDLGANARLIHLTAGKNGEINKLAVYPHLPNFARRVEDFRSHNDLQYDLIYSHYWLSAWAGRQLQRWWEVPHMVMFHTLGAVKNAIGVGDREPELRIETERSAVRSCDRIIAATEREKKDLVHFYGARPEAITVIPCGVNTELFRPLDRRAARERLALNGDKHLLFVGRIEPLKGVDRLLGAVGYLGDRHPLQLLVIGGGWNSRRELERLKALARELDIEERVTFLGLVKQAELPFYYSAADVCVVPSHYESFGLVALESLACGTPVVATDVGCAPGVIRQGQTGYVVPANDPHLLAGGIDRALSLRADGNGLAAVRRASLAPYEWPAIAAALEKECRSLLRV